MVRAVGGRVRQDLVDDADSVEADHDRQPPPHRRRLEPAGLLQPPHVPLDVRPDCGQRSQTLFVAPAQEDPKVGVGVETGLAAVAAEIGGDRRRWLTVMIPDGHLWRR